MSESNYLSKLEDYLRKQGGSKKSDSYIRDEASKILNNKSLSSYKDSTLQLKSFTREKPIKDHYKGSTSNEKSNSAFGVQSLVYETRNYNNLVEECLNFQNVDTRTSYDIKSFLPKETKAGFQRKYEMLKAEYTIKETDQNMSDSKHNSGRYNYNNSGSFNNGFLKETSKTTTNRIQEKQQPTKQESICCNHCKRKLSDGQKSIDNSLRESERINNNISNDHNQETQKEIAFFEIYHEDDGDNNEVNYNRELDWVLLEHNDQLNNNLITAYLDFEI